MLRLTEIKLPLDHSTAAIAEAAIALLGIAPRDLISCAVFRRAHDARRKSSITITYSLNVEIKNGAAVRKRLSGNRHVRPAPGLDYHFIAHAPATLSKRPL